MFTKIKFFKDKDPNFIMGLLPLLKTIKIEKNEFLFREGDFADESNKFF
jgi:hypothetical protein